LQNAIINAKLHVKYFLVGTVDTQMFLLLIVTYKLVAQKRNYVSQHNLELR